MMRRRSATRSSSAARSLPGTGLPVGVGVGETDGETEGVGVGDGDIVGVGVGDGDIVGVGVDDMLGLIEGDALGVGLAVCAMTGAKGNTATMRVKAAVKNAIFFIMLFDLDSTCNGQCRI